MSAKFCPQCRQTYSASHRFCAADNAMLSLPDPYHLLGRTLLDKYRIDALVGLGGMGAVYCAYHLGIDRRVAFKILQPNIAVGDEQMLVLFEREAKVAGRLAHENIVDVKDAGRTPDGIAYIVMEWLDGRTLDEELRAQGRLSFRQALDIARQTVAALSEAHAKHVVHRDLKPANVMLLKRPAGPDLVKVLDFGIGKIINDTAGSSVSAIMGTPNYASPEQLQLGGKIDGRSDIYSLGVMLFRMLTGGLPFNSTSLPELIQMQLTMTPARLRALRPETPEMIEQLVAQLLAKAPTERLPSAADVRREIDRALASLSLEDDETLALPPPPHSGETTIERRPKQPATEAVNAEPPTPTASLTPKPATLLNQSAQQTAQQPAQQPAVPPVRGARSFALGALLSAAALGGGYGVYRYAFNEGARSNDATPQLTASPLPTATPTLPPMLVQTPPVLTPTTPKPQRPAAVPTPVFVPPPAGKPPKPMQGGQFVASMQVRRARLAYDNGRYREALRLCNEALRLDPQNAAALALKAKLREVIRILDQR